MHITTLLFEPRNFRSCLRERAFFLVAVLLPILLATASTSRAASATWSATPGSTDWNTSTNWVQLTVPNGPGDTATFGVSNTTALSLSVNTEINGTVFNAGASPFTITTSPNLTLTISGVGITNNSGIVQTFVTAADGLGNVGLIIFSNNATAGTLTAFTNKGGTVNGKIGGVTVFQNNAGASGSAFTSQGGTISGATGGITGFHDFSTAGTGTFIANGGVVGGAFGGMTEFLHSTTAGNGTFTTNGGVASGANGGITRFLNDASAASGIFTTNGGTVSGAPGGQTVFLNTSSAGNGTFIANGGQSGGVGGTILFFESSTGDTPRMEIFGNGSMDISLRSPPGVGVGSIEGDGGIFLGANNLSVGSNNLDTTFSGVIRDGGQFNGVGGSLTKVGTGVLTLSGTNTYTGPTTVNSGTLLVKNKRPGNGTRAVVQVNAGTLGGTGKVAGSATIGTGSGPGAFLSPGITVPAILSVQRSLTFNADATFNVELNSRKAKMDGVVAKGVVINGGLFSFVDLTQSILTAGTVFTVINNTAATPITGTFGNLADGSTFTAGSNNFQVNYEGGNGNDLTLTVVP